MKFLKNFLVKYFGKICIFALLIFCLIFFPIFDSYFLIQYDNFLYKNVSSISSIVISLIPCVVTIISVSLSLQSELVFGVKRNEFNKLRGSFYINFLEQMLISIALIGSLSFYIYASLYVSILVVNCLSILLSIYFIFLEIPVLLKNKSYIFRILKRKYFKMRKETSDSKEVINILNSVISFAIIEYGLTFTINKLSTKKNKIEVFSDILYRYCDFLKEFLSNIKLSLINIESKKYENDIKTIIKKSYLNIESLFEENFLFDERLEKNDMQIIYYTRFILSILHDCSISIDNDYFEKSTICYLLDMISWRKTYYEKNVVARFNFESILSGLYTNDLWYLKYYKSTCVTFENFNENTNYFGVFLFIFLYYCCNFNKSITIENQNYIKTFLRNDRLGLNSFGFTWRDYLQNIIDDQGEKKYAEILVNLVNLYDIVPSNYYTIRKEDGQVYSINDDNTFSLDFLISRWIDIVASSYDYVSIDELDGSFKKLSDNDMEKIIDIFDNYLYEYETKSDRCSFLSFLGSSNELNEENLKILRSFKDKYHQSKAENPEKEEDPEIFAKQTKKVIEGFEESLEGFIFKCKSLNNNFNKMNVKLRIDAENCSNLIDFYIKSFKELFISRVNNQLESDLIEKIETDEIKLSEDEIKQIESFAPDYCSSSNSLSLSLLMHNLKSSLDLNKIKKINGLLRNVFLKKKAIKANFVINKKTTKLRPLTNDEISSIIDKEYVMDDGFYIYKEYDNDKKAFPITRQALANLLKAKVYVLDITFKESFEIVPEKVLIFKKKKD